MIAGSPIGLLLSLTYASGGTPPFVGVSIGILSHMDQNPVVLGPAFIDPSPIVLAEPKPHVTVGNVVFEPCLSTMNNAPVVDQQFMDPTPLVFVASFI